MTADEFERVFAAIRHMHKVNLGGMLYVPIQGVLENLLANLHAEDRALYEFDWANHRWKKYAPGEPQAPQEGPS